ncbi:hypothetical protein WRSd5_02798 [Shigella dysenteriae WRSd5]|nr:hypothetical protein WRSd5_02798 [Shigella dysenteriae WRSd5]
MTNNVERVGTFRFCRFGDGIIDFWLATIEALDGDRVKRFNQNSLIFRQFDNTVNYAITCFFCFFSIGFIEVSDHTPVTAVTKIRSVDNIKRGGTFFICATRNGFHRFANSIKTTGNHYTVKRFNRCRLLRCQFCCCVNGECRSRKQCRRQEGVLKLHKNNPSPCANQVLVLLLTRNVADYCI